MHLKNPRSSVRSPLHRPGAVRARLLVATTLMLLALPASALASSWSWGYNYLGPSTSNGNCLWYASHAVCGPSASDWNDIGVSKTSGGTVHVGFENANAIRGHYESGSAVDYVYVSETGFTGSIRPEGTYRSGATSYLSLAAN
jgi:hypothetical protein